MSVASVLAPVAESSQLQSHSKPRSKPERSLSADLLCLGWRRRCLLQDLHRLASEVCERWLSCSRRRNQRVAADLLRGRLRHLSAWLHARRLHTRVGPGGVACALPEGVVRRVGILNWCTVRP